MSVDLIGDGCQTDNGYGGCLGLSSHVSLGLNGDDLGELFEFEVLRDLLKVMLVTSQHSRKKQLSMIRLGISAGG